MYQTAEPEENTPAFSLQALQHSALSTPAFKHSALQHSSIQHSSIPAFSLQAFQHSSTPAFSLQPSAFSLQAFPPPSLKAQFRKNIGRKKKGISLLLQDGNKKVTR
ncbi:hypothetical protein [Psychromonas ingrahamii]|uniref:hypothetical protein n=1 Tax=Psychromonas ingrahamii TaxID=357794 RepID=UPI00059F4125|nr:hypothetical protein [Psychromonas ingrahamii]